MQDNPIFQAKQEQLLGYIVKPNLFVAPVLDIHHILRVGLQINLRSLTKRKKSLQGATNSQQFPHGRGLQTFLRGEELKGYGLPRHLLLDTPKSTQPQAPSLASEAM